MLARARGVDPGGNLVGIGLLPDLLRFESGPDGTIELGAALTLEWLAGPDGGGTVPPLLRAAAIATANPGIRSVATLGGNIADAGAASDLVAALIAWAPGSGSSATTTRSCERSLTPAPPSAASAFRPWSWSLGR